MAMRIQSKPVVPPQSPTVPITHRFGRFLLVGGFCTGLQYLLLVALVEGPGLSATMASTIGYAASSAVNYYLSYSFTFNSASRHRRSLPRFVLVGHSMAGAPLQVFAARHAERLAGLVFVDAIGSFQRLGIDGVNELVAHEKATSADVLEQRRTIESLLDTNARPATRARVLAALPRLPPEGFQALRISLFQFVVPEDLRGTGIPLFSIEVERPRPVSIFFSALAPEAPRKTLSHVVSDLFPKGGDVSRAEFWCGLRPMTPDGTPVIGATPIANLFLATGHGTLGWTMAAGTGQVMADVISGRAPGIDLSGLTIDRYAGAVR